MAGAACPAYHCKNNSGPPNTIFQKTTAGCPESKISNTFLKRYGFSNTILVRNECFGTRGSGPRLHVSNVSDSKERWFNSADFQFKKIKQVPISFKISSNKCTENPSFPATIRLANKDRSVKCLLPCTNRKDAQALSTLNLQGPSLSNDLPSFRDCLRPKSVRLPLQLGSTSIEGQRFPCCSLSGRLLYCQSGPHSFTKSKFRSHSAVTAIRVASEFQKINFDPTKSNRVSGNRLGPACQQKISTGQKMQRYRSENKKVVIEKESKPKADSEHSRFPEFCQFSSITGPTQSSNSSKTLSKSPPSSSESTVFNSPRGPRRAKLVANKHFEQVSNTLPARVTLPGNRCIRVSMGGASGQYECLGTVAPKPICSSLKSTRITGCVIRPKRSLSLPSKFDTPDSERQQDCSGIFEKRRRHEIASAIEHMLQDFSNIGPSQYSYRDSLPARTIQPRSRSLVSIISSTGMAPAACADKESIPQVGNTTDRSICISDSTRGSDLRISGCDRLKSSSTRLFQQNLEFQSGVAVSSAIPNTTGTDPSQYSHRDLLAGSPSVAESVLETRPTESRAGCSIHDPQSQGSLDRHCNRPASTTSPGHDAGSLEMWGWSESLEHWSREQRDFLFSSWRTSSLKTYKPAWEKWTAWSRGNSINTFKPSGSDLARFLIDLYQDQNLSYSTILVYKSAISTLCDPSSDNRLSSHVLVKHALKAIRNKNPRVDKAPIWDTDCLRASLLNTPVNENSLFECSKRAATLLLLCSGRRVHDLCLLRIDSNNCFVSENSITFWPEFGSKTDSSTHRQSGWRFLVNKESKALDPTFWLKKVISLSTERRNICKSNNLFLTACGPPKAATPTIIANWVKKVLMDAGIKASPGSIRPAVASKNWVQECPLEDILARGNWRSLNTFRKYYCRVIKPRDPLSCTSNCFVPIHG